MVSHIKEAAADQRAKCVEIAKTGAQDGSWKATTPPGRTNRDSWRKTEVGSGSHIRMKRPTAASNGSLAVIWETSDWIKLTLCRPASATRALALAIERPSRSTPSTFPEGPTSRAASIATSPTPQPISKTRWPALMPASRKNRSEWGARRAACRIRRSCSASVLPSAYGEAGLLVLMLASDSTIFRPLRESRRGVSSDVMRRLAFLPKTLNQFTSRWQILDEINAEPGVQRALGHCSFHASIRRSVII